MLFSPLVSHLIRGSWFTCLTLKYLVSADHSPCHYTRDKVFCMRCWWHLNCIKMSIRCDSRRHFQPPPCWQSFFSVTRVSWSAWDTDQLLMRDERDERERASVSQKSHSNLHEEPFSCLSGRMRDSNGHLLVIRWKVSAHSIPGAVSSYEEEERGEGKKVDP